MKYFISFLTFIIIVNSCTNKEKNKYVELVSDSIPTYYLNNQIAVDTLTYSNIIECVKYVPLETKEDCFISDVMLTALESNNNYIVRSGAIRTPIVKMFNSNGKYVANVLTVGRGPKETTSLLEWTTNGDKVCMFGFDKAVVYWTTNKKTQAYRLPNNEGIPFSQWCSVSKNKYAATSALPYMPEFNKNEIPYLVIMDSTFKIEKKIYYSKPRKIYQNLIPEITKSTEGWVLSSNGTEPLFIDVFNDTVYKIDTNETLLPKYILKRTKEQMPKVEETNAKQSKIADKIHFTKILDGKDYICLNTINGAGKTEFYLWNKNKENPICVNSMCRIPVSFDGFHGELMVDQVIGNTIIAAIPANKLTHVLPGLKEDDNPVVVEIKLKDNYIPEK
ncbi:MAG: 6-bladed beta-propeller [Salinivirgaceae bacterium]|nr:6-bladed beta-propeller [Salinivirgaceae bacterium]